MTARLTVCFQVAKLRRNWLGGELVSFVGRPVLLVLATDGGGARQAGEARQAGRGGGRGGGGHLADHLLAGQQVGEAGGRLGGRGQRTVACNDDFIQQ